ncbi:RNA polymerase sigma factor [Aquimarina brevivitae]|uniref:RNA polymerase sigma-70 factor (ECF subfamily) n=1 Tax=Aquimarina brevivitae TaxID=323412 RepID=A0A4Q7P1Z6_9FLAO|nr:sigma-70 family RNA polymerase sigma factor [Aquimarina brevivitae]RZS93358.1 RNA polymerase sigma-70 factor (ECF subfamily) [Aquimarina brevivitae]
MQPTELIIALRNKDKKAFEEIYKLYADNVYGIVFNILRNEDVSEEVTQDVFLKIWEKIDSYTEKKGRFFTWVLNIARNAAIDKTRSKGYKKSGGNLSTENFVDILEDKTNFNAKVDSIGIKKFINGLEPLCKKVIDLLFFKGYTQKEASEELEIPLGTIKTRNRICIDKLKKVLAV